MLAAAGAWACQSSAATAGPSAPPRGWLLSCRSRKAYCLAVLASGSGSMAPEADAWRQRSASAW